MIAVLDYGVGNLASAQKAFVAVGADACLVADAAKAARADAIVVPGVGAFGACVTSLRAYGLDAAVRQAVNDGRPVLGICVGMQMLFSESEESPGVDGLGILPGEVRLMCGRVLPQMQWNALRVYDTDMFGIEPVSRGDTSRDDMTDAGSAQESTAARDCRNARDKRDAVDAGVFGRVGDASEVSPSSRDGLWMYFVHSYAAVASRELVAATCEYDGDVIAAVRRENVWGVQFHPEKSGRDGLNFLRNFVRCVEVEKTGRENGGRYEAISGN